MRTILACCLCGLCLFLASCVSTKDIPDDDQLFVGLKKITYDEDTITHKFQSSAQKAHLADTKAEVELALATAPNGALFGSSYYRVPFSWRLWVYNIYSGKDSKFARWMAKSFGKPPVLMSQVNPALRASVAQSVLKNNGYFRANVTYEAVPQKNPKKSKIAYHVRLDSLFTLDSIAYLGFPDSQRQLIDSTAASAYTRQGAPFSVTMLENERDRLSTLLRNNGYYYYSPAYTTYQADTFALPNKVQLRIQLADGLPDEALKPWYIGNTEIAFRRTMREQLSDSIHRRHLHIFFNGKKPPIRPRVVLKNMRLRPRRPYSYADYLETVTKINATGVFSSVDLQLTPRDTDTLDLRLNCTFDKPYDFYFETNFNARTIGRFGPEAKIGFTKRNVFHGAEKLDVNLHGSYEWQKSGDKNMNNYQYGADASIEFPRIIAPFVNSERSSRDRERERQRLREQGNGNGENRPLPRRFISASTTLAKASTDIIHRPGYYKMHIATGEWTYRWQSSEQSRHEFSPLTLKYQFMNSRSGALEDILDKNMYLASTLDDQFIPKMRYTYVYTSPTTLRNPIRWETTVEEAGNGLALYDVLLQGHKWNQKDKTFFKNPYAQFVRLETDFTKTWQLSNTSQLVGHINAGVIRSYGNTESIDAPFSELFYVGGANSIRAFTVRSIGPGSFNSRRYDQLESQRQFNYLMQNGDIKFVGNLEYRSRLFGNLEGALFLDLGNVWRWDNIESSHDAMLDMLEDEEYASLTEEDKNQVIDTLEEWFSGWKPSFSTLFDQIAVGTGFGLRYDLGFLVVRIDWGLAIHAPYDTGKSGYFNINRFRDAHTLHFAIGYPF